MHVLGVDGCRGGWIGIRHDGDAHEQLVATTLAELCAAAEPVAVVAVDMPIVLTDDGRRPCDDQVRPLLGPRRSSLFSPPPRPTLGCATHDEANAWSKLHTGRGISVQAWNLVPKIREARAVAEKLVLYEAFPELAFAAMNDGVPLPEPKRGATGQELRRQLLAEHGLVVSTTDRPPGVGVDDVLDAAALAWSAWRIHRGIAERRPLDVDPPGLSPQEPSIWW